MKYFQSESKYLQPNLRGVNEALNLLVVNSVNNLKKLLSMLISISLSVPPTALASPNGTYTPDDESFGPKDGKYSYQIVDPLTEKSRTMDVEIRSFRTKEELQEIKAWMKEVNSSLPDNSQLSLTTLEEEGQELKYIHELPQLDYDNIEKIKFRTGLWGKIADLGDDLSTLTKRKINGIRYSISNSPKLEAFKNKVASWIEGHDRLYRGSLALVRFTGVGYITMQSFVLAGKPELLAAGIAFGWLGALSGAIQYRSDIYANIVNKLQWFKALTTPTLAKLVSLKTGENYEVVKDRLSKTAMIDVTNQLGTFAIIEIPVVLVAMILFAGFGDPLQTETFEIIMGFISTVTLATLSQGSWDVSIARKDELANRRIDLMAGTPEEKAHAHTMKKLSTATKIFLVALGTNFAAMLNLGSDGWGLNRIAALSLLAAFTVTGFISLTRTLAHDYPEVGRFVDAIKSKFSKKSGKCEKSFLPPKAS